jgi:hypothetical protein
MTLPNPDQIRVWIEAALRYAGGTHTFEDVADNIRAGRMQLWPTQRGCAVTEIVVYPQKKVLNVFLAAGDMDQVLDGIDAVAAWGSAQGCTAMTMSGRTGWKRVLGARGWEPTMITMEKEI